MGIMRQVGGCALQTRVLRDSIRFPSDIGRDRLVGNACDCDAAVAAPTFSPAERAERAADSPSAIRFLIPGKQK